MSHLFAQATADGLGAEIIAGALAVVGGAIAFLGRQFQVFVAALKDGTLVPRQIDETHELTKALLAELEETRKLRELILTQLARGEGTDFS